MSSARTATGTATSVGTHSCVLAPHLKHELTTSPDGKYGRMFPDLPCNECGESIFAAIASSGAAMDEASAPTSTEETSTACIPAGYPIFGQLIAHNITADRSLLLHHTSLGAIRNMRTPSLNLESLYLAGPLGSPYLYDHDDPDKLLIGRNDAGNPDDLPRNSQGVALLGDPRDDVHLLISQLHVALLKFHNAVVDHLRAQAVAPERIFDEAQRLTRWHYQWVAVHDYLPHTVGEQATSAALTGRAYYQFDERPFIPVEFSDAAYRAGHSQIRSTYRVNDQTEGTIFPDLLGGRPVPASHVVDWRYFFDLDPSRPPQPSKRIDTRLAHALIDLPPAVVGAITAPEEASLAYRDLRRARSLDLPSGEAVAQAMGIQPLTLDEVGLRDAIGWQGETPLWYYVLREAQVREGGVRLGPVGGQIVAEVLVGLLDGDPASYRAVAPDWQPTLPAARPGSFTIADLLRFAGAA